MAGRLDQGLNPIRRGPPSPERLRGGQAQGGVRVQRCVNASVGSVTNTEGCGNFSQSSKNVERTVYECPLVFERSENLGCPRMIPESELMQGGRIG